MKQTWNRRPPIFFSKSGNSLKYPCFQFCSLPYLIIRVKKVNFLGLVISIRNTKHTNYKGLFTVKYYGLGKKITRPLLMKELTINCHCRFFSFSVCIKRKLANNFSVFFCLSFVTNVDSVVAYFKSLISHLVHAKKGCFENIG